MNAVQRNEAQAQAAYTSGDYSRAARLAESDELRGCALILVGALQDGLALLEGANTPRALYHRAFALWGSEDADTALTLFKQVTSDPVFGKAASLIAGLLDRGEIRILFQGRDDPSCPDYDIVGALRAIPYVDVVTIGYSPRSDIMINYSSTLDDVMAELPLDWEPDLFVSHLVEDNPPPLGIEEAPFPTIAHTQDYDRHVHHCYHYLQLFDAVIALGSADYDDVSKLSHLPTFVFPLLLGVDVKDTQEASVVKENDVFISGTLFTNTHGKSKSIFEIAQMPDEYRIKLKDGFIKATDYFRELSRAKLTFTHVNRWGALNGRAVEAISVGTCALYQSGGELAIFLSEEEGAVPYEADNYVDVLKRVVAEWDTRYAQAAQRGSKKVHELFDFKNCIRLYLNFLMHVVGMTDKAPQRAPDPIFSRIRYPSRSPWRISFHYSENNLLMQLQDKFRQAMSGCHEYGCMDAVGESFLYSAISVRRFNLPQQELVQALLNASLSVYQGLITTFPNRLAAWFNLGRICFELNELDTAKTVFESIHANPQLCYDPNDLLFWREFQDGLFDYDRMMEEMVNYRKAPDDQRLRTIETLIHESVVFYLANIDLAQGRVNDALTLLRDNVTDKTEFVPSWMLRSILNLHMSQGVEALSDLQMALGKKEYLIAKLDQSYFNMAKAAGLDVAKFEARLRRLNERMIA